MTSARERRRKRRQEIVQADNERTAQAYDLAEVEVGRPPLDARHTAAGYDAYCEKVSELAREKFQRLH